MTAVSLLKPVNHLLSPIAWTPPIEAGCADSGPARSSHRDLWFFLLLFLYPLLGLQLFFSLFLISHSFTNSALNSPVTCHIIMKC